MHIHFLDPYQSRLSAVHRLDPRVKFVLAVMFILTAALTPVGAWSVFILLLAAVLSSVVLSELGVLFVLKRSLLAAPFVLAAVPLIFTIPGENLLTIGSGDWSVSASQAGMERFLSIALKSWISVQAAVVLASSTRFPDLMAAMRAVGIPPLLVAIFGLMWRYLFVLADEALRLMRARQARSGQSSQPGIKPGGSLAWRARVTGGMAGSLFLRAFERSDRIYTAMLSRGYDGEARSEPLPPLHLVSWLVLFVGLGISLTLLAVAYLLLP